MPCHVCLQVVRTIESVIVQRLVQGFHDIKEKPSKTLTQRHSLTHPLPSLTLPCTPYTPYPPPQRHTPVCHYFFFFINITPYPPLHPLHTHTSTRYDPAKSLRINSLDAHASKINIQVMRSEFQFFRANGHTRPSVGQLHTFFPKRPRSEGSPSASNSATPAAVSLISSDSGSD